MPPQLATLICILLILYLFWMDLKKKEKFSKALWFPFIWVFLDGSRYVSSWLSLRSPTTNRMDLYMEGSPVDSAVFFCLILASVIVLIRRRFNWKALFENNPWLWLFFFFGLISILWSDYPFVSFKRWIKAFGSMSMALVIMTEERPYQAVGVILKRLAFLLLPLSVLFIKYYPDLGRAYHMGLPMFTGVTQQKNSLGELCLLTGIYFCWNLLFKNQEEIELGRRLHFSIYLIILPMIVWLLYMSNSATSIVCLTVAIFLFIVSRIPAVALVPKRIMVIGIACILLFLILNLSFDLKSNIIAMLGRKPDLTSRVPIWNELLNIVKNPIVGVGYEVFWAGERMTQIWEKVGPMTNAHNGYLDIYLNLGIIGLCLLLISIIAGTKKAIEHLNHDYAYAMLRISIIIVVLLYNWTEATFKPLSNMFLLLLVGILEMPGAKNDQKNSIKYGL